ncbi:MAG: DMT family transporter [Cellvibrionaceae bacterium]
MANITAYIILIAIWSTTPLAIKWSAVDISFAGGIFWRILLSASLALIILRVKGGSLFIRPKIWRFYAIGAMGIAPNFLLVYWSSQWIPSGLISVIFSAVPFLMGVLSYYWLGKNVFTFQRVIALMIAMLGIIVIFYDQLLVVGTQGAYGIAGMLLSVITFAVSSTWLQRVGGQVPALQTTTGSLCFSVPPLALVWWWVDGILPFDIGVRSTLSIIYLGIVGSLIGFFLYYFLLQRLSAYVVSTVGMISPVFALMIGAVIANETLGARLILGAVMVLVGLALYHVRSLYLMQIKSVLKTALNK